MMVRNRRHYMGQSQSHMTTSEMIAMLNVQSLLIDAPSTSVRQTIDVQRLEDEIVSGPPPVSGSSAITFGAGSTETLTAAISDYDTVSEKVISQLSQVYLIICHSRQLRVIMLSFCSFVCLSVCSSVACFFPYAVRGVCSFLMQFVQIMPAVFSTRGQSNLTKAPHSPVRGHPRGSKVVPLNSGVGFPISVP